ncbi:hypothetical protein LguiB_013646 [Lonicera macranthoides]
MSIIETKLTDITSVGSVTELGRYGIKIVKGNGHLLNIKYTRTLKVPPLLLDYGTVHVFQHLVAYEQCGGRSTPSYFTTYIMLLSTRTGPTISGGQTDKAYEFTLELVGIEKVSSYSASNQVKEVFEASTREAELFRPSFFHEGRAMTVMDSALISVSLAYNHLGNAMLPVIKLK